MRVASLSSSQEGKEKKEVPSYRYATSEEVSFALSVRSGEKKTFEKNPIAEVRMIIIQILNGTIQKIRERNITKLVLVKEMLYYNHTSE